MKKIYSLVTLFVMAILGMTASAKTMTVTVNMPDGLEGIMVGSTTLDLTSFAGSAAVEVDITDQNYMRVQAKTGYLFESITIDDEPASGFSPNTEGGYVTLGDVVEDGAEMVITLKKLDEKTVTLKFDDISHISSITVNSRPVTLPESNEVSLTFFSNVTSATVEGKSIDGGGYYMVSTVTYPGGELTTVNSRSGYINLADVNDGDVIEIATTVYSIPTYIVRVNNASRLSYVNLYPDYSNYTPASSFVNNEKSFTTSQSGLYIKAADGYNITSVTVDGRSVVNSLPSDEATVSFSGLNSGDVIEVVFEEKAPVIYTFQNANGIKFTYHYNTVTCTENEYVLTMTDEQSVELTCADADKAIVSVTAQDGTNAYLYDGKVTIGPKYSNPAFNKSTTFTINTTTVELASFFVDVDESANVSLQQQFSPYDYIPLVNGRNEIKFNPYSSNKSFSIGHSNYQKKLVSITKNGQPVEFSGNYYYTANAGDELVIVSKMEDYDVPVKFSFVNEGTEAVVTRVAVDGKEVTNWADENFTVKLGSVIQVALNYNGYEIVSYKMNGTAISPSSTISVDSKNPIELQIEAVKYKGCEITLTCPQWQHLNVFKSVSYDEQHNQVYSDPVELTGETTTFEVDRNSSYFIVPQEGYYISASQAFSYQVPTAYISAYASADATIDIELTAINRDKTAVVFVDESVSDFSFTLSHPVRALSVYYSKQSGNLKSGYNTVNFGSDAFSFTGSPLIYINGELYSKNAYNYYDDFRNPTDNTVIKVFAAEPESFEVSFNVAEDADVVVTKDIVTAVDPAAEDACTAEAFTQFCITNAAENSEIAVKVNGTAVTPDADGAFVFTVTEATAVEVSVVKPTTFTISADDPAQVVFSKGGEAIELAEGDNVIEFKGQATYIISGVNGNKLYSVTVNDEELTPDGSTYSYTATDGDKVVVKAIFPEVFGSVKVTFAKEGTQDAVNAVAVNGEVVDDFSSEFQVKVGNRVSLTLNNGKYDITLTLNGQPLETTSFTVEEEADYTVEVTAELKPEKYAPVAFSFANEGTEEALTGVKVDGKDAADFSAADFKVLVGSTVEMEFSADYDVTVAVNDTELDGNSFVAESEREYNVVITAAKRTVVTTIVSDHFADLEVYTGADKTSPVALEARSTDVEVEKGAKIYIFAKAGHYISAMADTDGGKYTVPVTSAEITADHAATITISVAELVRESNLTVFVEEKAVAAAKFTLADADMPELAAVQTAAAGYNTFKFAENDQLSVAAAQGAVEVYVDGTKVDAAEPIADLTETTVVKVFSETPQSWNMTYTFGEGIEVEVYHDHVTKIESPATHSVFHGTHVAIKPVEAAPEASKAAAAKLEVKVNGQALTPNAEGFYEFTAQSDVEIAVAKESSGLEWILVDGQDADIYNLQGIKVGNTAHTSDLPAGIYIINGQKIRF